jgi:tRNA-Thr(GGU) m(6)t(6)A37 methyltransferase TsaA
MKPREIQIIGSTLSASIEMRPIGFVRRTSRHENDRDRSLVAKVVLDEALAPALDGIEDWSHIYVIFWLDRVGRKHEPVLHHRNSGLGIFAARSPIHPNPIGLTLVELVKRRENVLWVRALDAYDETPVLDIKPYPDWVRIPMKSSTCSDHAVHCRSEATPA